MREKVIKKILSVTIIINLTFPLGMAYAEEAVPTAPPTPTTQETVQPENTDTTAVPTEQTAEQNSSISTQDQPQVKDNPTSEEVSPTPDKNCGNDGSVPLLNENNNSTTPAVDNQTGNNEEVISAGNNDSENRDERNHQGGDERAKDEVNTENNADVFNDFWEAVNTGTNDVSHNDADVNLKTGNANSVLDLINFINSNFITTENGEIVYIFKNIYSSLFGDYILDPLTGDVYDLNGVKIKSEDVKVENNNDANLTNNIDLVSNTGYNEARYNDGNTAVRTGDANTALNLFNLVNSNFIATEKGVLGAINIFGDFLGDLLLPEWLTSAFSNTPHVGDNITNITGNNFAEVVNNIFAKVNTGGNQAKFNDGSTSVTTGDASALVNLKNIVNTNVVGDVVYFFLVNVTGEWEGESELPYEVLAKDENGASLLFTNLFDVIKNTTIENNNNALLTNNINLWANSGLNEVSHNDGNVSLATGDANVIANIINLVNTNLVGKKIVFLTVNIFGDWRGDIRGVKDKETAGEQISNESISPIVLAVKNTAKKNAGTVGKFAGWNFEDQNSEPKEQSLMPTDAEISEAEAVLGKVKDLGQENFTKNWLSKARPYLVIFLVVYLGFLSVYLRRGNIKKG